MGDDAISQAEIDALVRGMISPADTAPAVQETRKADAGGLKEPMREFAINAGRALTELVGVPCQGSLAELVETTLGAVSDMVSGELLGGKTSLQGGLSGTVLYAVPGSLGMEMITQLYGGIAPSALDDSALGALADGLTQINQVGFMRLGEMIGAGLSGSAVQVEPVGSMTELGAGGADLAVIAVGVDMVVAETAGRIYVVLPKAQVASPLEQQLQAKAAAKVTNPAGRKADDFNVDDLDIPTGGSGGGGAKQSNAAASAFAQAQFPELPQQRPAPREDIRNIDLLMDVSLQVTVELGRTRRQIREVLALGPGSVLELDKLAGEQVDVLVNGKLIAKGEVVVIDENYGVRITDIISPVERVQSLK